MYKKKEALLDLIQRHAGLHMNAEELVQLAREENLSISQATVYRNLAILVDEQKIKRISLPQTSDRYDAITVDHAHMYCTECHALMDLDSQNLADSLHSALDIPFEHYDLLLFGKCEHCQADEEASWM